MKLPIQNDLGSHPDFPDSRVALDGDLGFYRTIPYPSEELLERFYTQEYRSIRQESPDENYLKFMRHRAIEQTKYIIETSARQSFQGVMDIGCGCGELLNALQPYSQRLNGFETDRVMSAHATTHRRSPSIEIHNEHYSTLDRPLECDLITMSHVLEHIPEPVEFLKDLRECTLTTDGLMFIEVPNDPLYWLKRQIARKQRGLGHLNYFTPESLASTLSAAGFKTLDTRMCGITLHQHIRRLERGRLGRLSTRVMERLFPTAGKLPDYTLSAPDEDGIYLQTLAIASQ
jgi:2-polyprenyl-3-methyl-5-hydroxy-6-metoxy-1,4-benzoquinol methylase